MERIKLISPDALVRKQRVYRAFFIVAFSIIFLLFLVRVRFTIDYYDEFFNTAVAYQSVLGQTFLSDIWNFFQTGDAIQIPFLWVYTSLVGSTEGVILAGRLYYVICCIIIGLFAYDTLKSNRIVAFATALCIVCYAPFSLSYWWYDTAMMQFALIGGLLLVRAQQTEIKSRKQLLYVLSGVFHAILVFSYPFAILGVLCCAVILVSDNNTRAQTLWYILGTMLLAIVFILYCASIGFDQLFFIRQNYANSESGLHLEIKGRSYLLDFGNYGVRIGKALLQIVKDCRGYFIGAGISSLLLVLFFKKKYWRLSLVVLFAQVPIAFALSFMYGGFATIVFFLYFFLLVPACYFILRKTDQRIHAANLFRFLWIPSLFLLCAVAITALGDASIKCLYGLYCGSISGICLVLLYMQSILGFLPKRRMPQYLLLLLGLMILSGEVLLYVINPYRSERAYRSDYKMETGVCKGIISVQADKYYEGVEQELDQLLTSKDKTILTLDRSPYLYLMSERIAASSSMGAWNEDYAYWEQVTGMPDIIVLLPELLQEKSQRINETLRTQYQMIGTAGEFDVYRISRP